MSFKKCVFIIIQVVAVLQLNDSVAQDTQFVNQDFPVPDSLITIQLKIKPLTRRYTERDYAAIMLSHEYLKGVFGPNSPWPLLTLTLEEHRSNVEAREMEFLQRSSFTYTVLNTDESQVIGCVYIYPTIKKPYDAQITLWTSQSAFNQGLDQVLFDTVKEWVRTKWPFTKVAYPGREISWPDWISK
jgi:hypothetical protein